MAILATLSILAGILSTLTLVSFMLLGMANMNPTKLRWMVLATWAVAILGLVCAVFAGILLWQGKPGTAAIVGIIPAVIDITFIIVALALGV